jgi:polyribonucleotide nucleotidyltransferase
MINPEKEQWEQSDLELLISASADAILMVEGEAKEVPEDEMLEALLFGHEAIKNYIKEVSPAFNEWAKPKREFVPVEANTTLTNWVTSTFSGDARSCLSIDDKLERQNAVAALVKKVKTQLAENPAVGGLDEKAAFGKEAYAAVDDLLYVMMRKDIISEEKRIAGRKLDQVRQIDVEVDVLARPHGSSLFTRGETQVLATATIGSGNGAEKMDRITGMEESLFYLHYSFPPFSVGDARGIRGVSRRELGHGNLAERAIKAVIPDQADFPYCIRLFCEVLESNGSSSMGSVCSGSMALMDAGVPLKKPVAGIAMGLIKEGEQFKILSDILGDEDHLGDMDFKVAGTDAGITAIQMDIKITGITTEIMKNAMAQAKVGRIHILNEMTKAVTSHRTTMKEGVPRMETLKIPKDKIGALIGPGGKNIKGFQEKYDVEIECLEDGTVKLVGTSTAELQELAGVIELQINGPKPGTDFLGTVVTIKEYGAFVDIAPGVSGLLHVSEFSDERVNDPAEYVAEGDQIDVRVTEVDKMGRLKLSAKVVKPLVKKS